MSIDYTDIIEYIDSCLWQLEAQDREINDIFVRNESTRKLLEGIKTKVQSERDTYIARVESEVSHVSKDFLG